MINNQRMDYRNKTSPVDIHQKRTNQPRTEAVEDRPSAAEHKLVVVDKRPVVGLAEVRS